MTPGIDYSRLLENWNLDFSAREGIRDIQGSPERTLLREVLRDASGSRWILEAIEPDNLARKEQIAFQLDALSQSGLSRIHPYRATRRKSCFALYQKKHWMLRPFIDGIALDRETYLDDLWRAEVMSEFLIQLHSHARQLTPCVTAPFSIATYAEGRMEAWSTRYSALVQKLTPSFDQLQEQFFPIHDQLPTAFCHGDYHPINMIWGEGCIESVIDWEFCGVKPEMYDVALLLGCLGFDEPDALIHDLVIKIVRTLHAAELYSAESWDTLIDLMATIRYGWMSEWIRRSDSEAAEMEVVYIDILLSQKDFIVQRWA